MDFFLNNELAILFVLVFGQYSKYC
jgi:hypothetical protein